MTFPDMTTTTINVPKSLLEEIDTYAEKHLLNRSACMRLLTAKGLKDATANPEHPIPSIPVCGDTGMISAE